MLDDHRALLEQVRKDHGEYPNIFCLLCSGKEGSVLRPCLPARLADSLEAAERRAAESERMKELVTDAYCDLSRHFGDLRERLERERDSAHSRASAAERRAAELEQEHRRATDEQIGFVARQRERLHLADAAAAEFRTALVFYAEERNYDEETGAAGKWRRLPNTADEPGETVFEHDGGDVARAALLKDAGKNTLTEIERLKDQVNRLCDRLSEEWEKTAALEQRAARAEAERADLLLQLGLAARLMQVSNQAYQEQAARLAQAERERDEALTERADLEIGLTLCQDDLSTATRSLTAARTALDTIREATNLALPSEQNGPEWEQCVRVPVVRMNAIDAAVASVLGEPEITNEPKPALGRLS